MNTIVEDEGKKEISHLCVMDSSEDAPKLDIFKTLLCDNTTGKAEVGFILDDNRESDSESLLFSQSSESSMHSLKREHSPTTSVSISVVDNNSIEPFLRKGNTNPLKEQGKDLIGLNNEICNTPIEETERDLIGPNNGACNPSIKRADGFTLNTYLSKRDKYNKDIKVMERWRQDITNEKTPVRINPPIPATRPITTPMVTPVTTTLESSCRKKLLGKFESLDSRWSTQRKKKNGYLKEKNSTTKIDEVSKLTITNALSPELQPQKTLFSPIPDQPTKHSRRIQKRNNDNSNDENFRLPRVIHINCSTKKNIKKVLNERTKQGRNIIFHDSVTNNTNKINSGKKVSNVQYAKDKISQNSRDSVLKRLYGKDKTHIPSKRITDNKNKAIADSLEFFPVDEKRATCSIKSMINAKSMNNERRHSIKKSCDSISETTMSTLSFNGGGEREVPVFERLFRNKKRAKRKDIIDASRRALLDHGDINGGIVGSSDKISVFSTPSIYSLSKCTATDQTNSLAKAKHLRRLNYEPGKMKQRDILRVNASPTCSRSSTHSPSAVRIPNDRRKSMNTNSTRSKSQLVYERLYFNAKNKKTIRSTTTVNLKNRLCTNNKPPNRKGLEITVPASSITSPFSSKCTLIVRLEKVLIFIILFISLTSI